MADAEKVFGIATPIRHGEESYEIAPFQLRMIGLMQRWLKEQEYADLARVRHRLELDIYRERLDSITRVFGGRAYDFHRPLFHEFFDSEDGFRLRLFLQINAGGGNITEEIAADIYETSKEEVRRILYDQLADPRTPDGQPWKAKATTSHSGNGSLSKPSSPVSS